MSDEFNNNQNNQENIWDSSGSSRNNSENSYSPFESPAAKKREKKKSGSGKIIAVALVCALLGGCAGGGLTAALLNRSTSAPSDFSGSQENSAMYEGIGDRNKVDLITVDGAVLLSDAEIYAANVNSTVGITTSITTTNYWGYSTTSAASGSGFIVTDDGFLLTNYHVIEDSNSITVTCYDGTAYDAALIGYDESNDIAVLKIDAQGLTPVILGDSSLINVGDHVVAIGNPLGELTFSLTQGAVSALSREVTFSNGKRMALIQTDTAINSGNSGGALFNAYGEVIGITNAKYGSSNSGASVDNIGFAIPINTVKNIVSSIIENGFIAKPYLGISILSVSADVQQYGLPAGASIQEVTAGSPAEAAGLQVNDIVTAADGKENTGMSI